MNRHSQDVQDVGHYNRAEFHSGSQMGKSAERSVSELFHFQDKFVSLTVGRDPKRVCAHQVIEF